MLVAPISLLVLSKPMVRLRCRCSCEMYGTSAVPLLVLSEESIQSIKKTFVFLGEILESASSPCPVNSRLFEIASNFLLCLKHYENQCVLPYADTVFTKSLELRQEQPSRKSQNFAPLHRNRPSRDPVRESKPARPRQPKEPPGNKM